MKMNHSSFMFHTVRISKRNKNGTPIIRIYVEIFTKKSIDQKYPNVNPKPSYRTNRKQLLANEVQIKMHRTKKDEVTLGMSTSQH